MSSSSIPSTSPASLVSLDLPPLAPGAMPVYLDNNATTPLLPSVTVAMMPFLTAGVNNTYFGNPSSSHLFGRSAKSAFEDARRDIATCIEAGSSDEIVILSGATESLNFSLIGGAKRQRALGRGNHIITSSFEHIATLEIVKYLADVEGFEVTILPVNEFGLVSAESVAAAVTPSTILISLMLANNEIGSILPIREIVQAVRATSIKNGRDIWVHTDASQAIGKMRVSVEELGVDMLTIAGHKIYAPKGIGALYIRHSSIGANGGLCKLIHGANHERDRRAGTENVLLAVGLGAACKEITNIRPEEIEQQFTQMRDALQASIEKHLQQLKEEHKLVASIDATPSETNSPSPPAPKSFHYDFRIHGHPIHRLSNTLSIGFHRINSSELLRRLSSHIAASAGSACHADSVQLSYVLQAIKAGNEYGMGTIRLSVGRFNTIGEMDQCGRWIAQTVVQLWIEAQNQA